jgi:orotate phosphoribosyltransferase
MGAMTTPAPLTERETLDRYEKRGALLRGHFRLTSGLHSDIYLQSALVLQHPEDAAALGRAIANGTRELGATVVLSPALGGVVIGHEVGRALGVRAIFAERQDGALMLRRGFTLAVSDRVIVIEDVLTTGGSTRETIEVARAAGAQVVGVASIVDRSGGSVRFGVPFVSLLDMSLPAYEPGVCPLCEQGIAVVKPGSRPVVA